MKLNEGELATPTFGDKNEEINGEALEHWSAFIKALSGIEKSFQGEKDQNKDIYVSLLKGMDEEVNRRLENVDAPEDEPSDEPEDKAEEDKPEEDDTIPQKVEAPADGEEGSDVSTEESTKIDTYAPINEAEKQTIRMMELAGLPHKKSRVKSRAKNA